MPVEETNGSIRVRVELPGKFQENSFRTITIDKTKGIQAVVGRLKGETKTSTQTFIFDKEKGWTKEKASKWVKDHGHTIKAFNLDDSIESKALEWLSSEQEDIGQYSIVKEFNSFETKANDDDDKRDGINISGFLSTFKNVDRHNDIVVEGAFNKTLRDIKKRGGKLPMLKDHKNETDCQIGSFHKFKVTEDGLMVEGFISKTDKTQHLIKLIEDGHLNTLSMGGLFRFKNAGEQDRNGRRFIEEVVLLEGSVVSIPANEKAQFVQKSLVSHEKSWPVEDSNAKKLSVREKVIETLRLCRK